MATTLGQIWKVHGDIADEDIDAMRIWLKQQPVRCKAVFSVPMIITDEEDMFDVEGDVLEIDNLTAEDRVTAASELKSILDWRDKGIVPNK